MWVGSPDSGLSLLTISGDAVDNLDPGWTLSSAVTSGSSSTLVFNDRDQAAFKGTIRLNNGPQVEALMAATPQGELIAVAMRGFAYEVAPGDSRIVSEISVWGSRVSGPIVGLGGDDGFGTCFNDRGELVYNLYFTDGTSGVFVTMIPTPGAAALLVLGGLFASRRRR